MKKILTYTLFFAAMFHGMHIAAAAKAAEADSKNKKSAGAVQGVKTAAAELQGADLVRIIRVTPPSLDRDVDFYTTNFTQLPDGRVLLSNYTEVSQLRFSTDYPMKLFNEDAQGITNGRGRIWFFSKRITDQEDTKVSRSEFEEYQKVAINLSGLKAVGDFFAMLPEQHNSAAYRIYALRQSHASSKAPSVARSRL